MRELLLATMLIALSGCAVYQYSSAHCSLAIYTTRSLTDVKLSIGKDCSVNSGAATASGDDQAMDIINRLVK